MDPHPNSALPPRIFMSTLALKLFLERTSYLQVRLEFLRYPQVIQALFNVPWFGPPVRFTAPSTCSWVGHMVSGLRHDTSALFRLGFPTAPSLQLNLASYRNPPVHSTKARPHPLTARTCCRHTVSGSISLSWGAFHLSSRNWFTIGH